MHVLPPLRSSLFALIAASLAFACGGQAVEEPTASKGDDRRMDAGGAVEGDDDDGASDDGASDDGASDDGASDDGASDDGATSDGATSDERPATNANQGSADTVGVGQDMPSQTSGPRPDVVYLDGYGPAEPIELDVNVPEECSVDYLSGSTHYCEFSAQCDAEFVYSYCYLQQTDASGKETWACDCQDGKSYRNMQFEDADPATLCPAVIELCAAGEEPKPVNADAEPVCSTDYRDSSSDWCNVELGCTQDATLGDALEVSLTERKSANCQRLDDDQWACSCYESSQQQTFTLKDVSNAPSLCVDIRRLCDEGGVAAEGEIACTPTQVSTGNNYCYGQLTCEQPASLAGTDVLASGRANVECVEQGDAWQCYCYGAPETVEFSLNGDAAWDVCNDALSACEDAVVAGGVLSQSGGYYGYEGRPMVAYADTGAASVPVPPPSMTPPDAEAEPAPAGGATGE